MSNPELERLDIRLRRQQEFHRKYWWLPGVVTLITVIIAGLSLTISVSVIRGNPVRDYYVLLVALGFGLVFGVPALIATWRDEREQRRRKELADKMHL